MGQREEAYIAGTSLTAATAIHSLVLPFVRPTDAHALDAIGMPQHGMVEQLDTAPLGNHPRGPSASSCYPFFTVEESQAAC